MTIQSIYDRYRIMPNLQLHQLRVAGVAKVVCEQSKEPLQSTEVIWACLLHDMGNILKFDLGVFPEAVEPQGLSYWQHVKEEFAQTYGPDEHVATMKIAQELGASTRVQELIAAIGFEEAAQNLSTPDFGKKICAYADVRVTPAGVTSVQARCQDLELRYGHRYPSTQDVARRQLFCQQVEQLELQIFAKVTLRPEDLTEERVVTTFPELQQLEWER